MMNRYDRLINRSSKRYRIYANIDRLEHNMNASEYMAPISIEVFPTYLCNSNCSFCVYSHEDNQSLDNKIFEEMVTQFIEIGVRSVTFSGGGEPTCHPYLSVAIERLSKAGIHIGLITNGLYYPTELIGKLKLCDWVRFSLLTHEKNVYSRLTGLNNEKFDQVIKNIRNTTAQKNSANTLIVSTTLMISQQEYYTLSKINDYIDLVAALDVDQIFFTERVEQVGNFTYDRTYYDAISDEIATYAKKKHVVTNIKKFCEMNLISNKRNNNTPCNIVKHNLIGFIDANGDVYQCFGHYILKREPLGNIYRNNLINLYQKKNITNHYIAMKNLGCDYCKNANTNYELNNYIVTGQCKMVNDPHSSFI